jgi:hypothetical protein
MENRVFVAATYPDGSPAVCDVRVLAAPKSEGPDDPRKRRAVPQPPKADNSPKPEPIATLKTNAAGLAEFRLTPKADQFRQSDWGERTVEMLGGQNMPTWGPKLLFDLVAEAER